MFTVQIIYYMCPHVAGEVKLFSIAAVAGAFKQDHGVGTRLSTKATTGFQSCFKFSNIAKT